MGYQCMVYERLGSGICEISVWYMGDQGVRYGRLVYGIWEIMSGIWKISVWEIREQHMARLVYGIWKSGIWDTSVWYMGDQGVGYGQISVWYIGDQE